MRLFQPLQQIGKFAFHARNALADETAAGSDLQVHRGPADRQGKTHLAHFQRAAAGRRQAGNRLGFLLQAIEQGQFLDGGDKIVPVVEIGIEAVHAGKHAGQDEFGRHQLPDRQLFLDHQPATQRQQAGRRCGIEEIEGDGLRELVGEMIGVGLHIIGRYPFRAFQRVIDVAGRFVEAVGRTHGFDEMRGVVFFVREDDRGLHRPLRPDRPHRPQQRDQHQVEGQEKRVIETGDNEPDDHAQDDGETADQQRRHRLLHVHHFKIAVEQIEAAIILKERISRVDRPHRHIGNQPRHEATAIEFHQVDAQHRQQARHDEQTKQDGGQGEQRHRQRGIGDTVDEQLHGNRRGKAKQGDTNAIDDRQPEIILLRPKNVFQPAVHQLVKVHLRKILGGHVSPVTCCGQHWPI